MAGDTLKEKIYDETWLGNYWGPEGVIALSKKVYLINGWSPFALSVISSTYYSAFTQAAARFRTVPTAEKFLWAFRSVFCLARAAMLSGRLEKLVGVAGMSADQLDVRGRILFRMRRYRKALGITEEALRRDCGPDSRALLLMGKAEILDQLGESVFSAEMYDEMFSMIEKLKPTTAVRLYKSLATHYRIDGEKAACLAAVQGALRIAEEHGLHDQKIKLVPLAKWASTGI